MCNTFRIRGARIVDPARRLDAEGDLLVVEGRITGGEPPVLNRDFPVLDARGCLLTPGFIDLHVHFREPGAVESESLASGAAAALRGGFTHVVTMPNTQPSIDHPAAVREQAAGAFAPRILPSACLTRGRSGRTVADLPALAAAGAVAFTDDGSTVSDDTVMLAAMRAAAGLNLPVMDHAVDPVLAGAGVIRDCVFARRVGLPVFPAEAESRAVSRDIALARRAGCRLHLQHLSTREAIFQLRAARLRGDRVTGEVTPHHLALAADAIPDDDAVYKMNPPLGTRDDIEALIEGLREGVVSALATDHAPHCAERKVLGFRDAPFGVIGLESAAAVTYHVLVCKAGFSLLDWVDRWTLGPAGVLGLPAPSLEAGQPANLALFDLRRPWTLSVADLGSKSTNCPFVNWTFPLRPCLTVCGGRIAWSAPF